MTRYRLSVQAVAFDEPRLPHLSEWPRLRRVAAMLAEHPLHYSTRELAGHVSWEGAAAALEQDKIWFHEYFVEFRPWTSTDWKSRRAYNQAFGNIHLVLTDDDTPSACVLTNYTDRGTNLSIGIGFRGHGLADALTSTAFVCEVGYAGDVKKRTVIALLNAQCALMNSGQLRPCMAVPSASEENADHRASDNFNV